MLRSIRLIKINYLCNFLSTSTKGNYHEGYYQVTNIFNLFICVS
ncbi:hypothetical protein [Klebsiella phage RothC]|uniref:Uncharacterized protein n=2 Tax=Viruses TaxID=10239 RepID=A0AB39C069_9CAUD